MFWGDANPIIMYKDSNVLLIIYNLNDQLFIGVCDSISDQVIHHSLKQLGVRDDLKR